MAGPLRLVLQPDEKRRVSLALAAWASGDRKAYEDVLDLVAGDPVKTSALVMGLTDAAIWMALHPGPFTPPDADSDGRGSE